VNKVYVVQKHYHMEGSVILGVYAGREEAVLRTINERTENYVPDRFTVTAYPADGGEGEEVFCLESK
jgi:hypothetical protein